MSSEIGSIDGFDYDSYSVESDPAAEIPNFHAAIYVPGDDPRFTKTAILLSKESLLSAEHRTNGIARFLGTEIVHAKNGGNVSVEGGWKASWGGEEGVEMSGYFKGEARDRQGNSANVVVEQNSDGKGNVEVSVKHKEEFGPEEQ